MRSGELVQMKSARDKQKRTLDTEYKDIDKLYKEQLIKTKAS
jgi:hypothetical protein